jgi:hypothetical protein
MRECFVGKRRLAKDRPGTHQTRFITDEWRESPAASFAFERDYDKPDKSDKKNRRFVSTEQTQQSRIGFFRDLTKIPRRFLPLTAKPKF